MDGGSEVPIARSGPCGTVTPVVDRHYPLSEAPKAIQYLLDGHARGKLVITLP